MILGFMLLVVGHEAGHWMTARMFGFKTPVFSIGFGPRQIKLKLFGKERTIPTSLVLGTFWETEFRLSPIPLGGYVAIPELGDETSGKDPIAASKFAPWKRAVVASAGIVMNMLMAVAIIFALNAHYGEPYAKVTSTYVATAPAQNSIAATAGLQSGDVFVSVDGTAVTTPEELAAAVKQDAGKTATIVVRRNGQDVTIVVTPDKDGHIGVALGAAGVRAFNKVGIVKAGHDAVTQSADMFWQTAKGVGMMLHIVPRPPSIPQEALAVHGPVGIVNFGATAYAQGGLWSLWMILAVISINLALLNLLPIPLLDGGHLLFIGIEKLRGKPLSKELQGRIMSFFFMLLIMLAVLALFNDITKPIG